MAKNKWLLALAFSLTVAITVFAGSLTTHNAAAQSPGNARGSLVMVTSADYPPYEYRETARGTDEIIGFDVDIAKYITQQLGYGLEIRDTDFNGIIPALQSKRADFAMAGMTPTPERRQNVDFSAIYYEAKNTLVTLKASKLKAPKDLIGKKLGVQLGSTQEKEAQKFQGVTVVSLNKTAELIQELKAKRIQAALLEDTIAKGFTAGNPDLEFHPIPNTEAAGSAIAFPKGSPLVGDFNRILKQMKESGQIETLVKKWFDANKTTAPAAASTSPLSFAKIIPSIPFMLEGILLTLQFTAISAVLGFIWGTVLSLFKISSLKPLVWFATAYTSIFRGTPLLLQIALVYYATPQLTGYNIPALLAGVITRANASNF